MEHNCDLTVECTYRLTTTILSSIVNTMLAQPLQTVNSVIAAPPTDWMGVSLTVLQTLGTFRGLTEVSSPTKYSKFVDNENILLQSKSVPAKKGFLIIYGPAFLVAAAFYALQRQQEQVGSLLVSSLLCLHFAKRILEVLMLHDFSGSKGMMIDTAMQISSYYAFVTYMIAKYAVDQSIASESVQWTGIACFAVGELGNLFHHILLRQLKAHRTNKSRRYLPPKGGLFEFVAAPHYLFEIVAWIGIALAAQQFNAYLEILSSLGYLMARAKNTNQMYMERFSEKEWPRSRKHLIPFVY